MLKKLLMLFLAIGFSLSAALAAAVEVNSADQTALESVKGIGPAHAKAILDERSKNGPFKDADDLVNRVKGIGPKSVQNLEAAGLTINGSSAPPAGKPAASAKSSKSTGTAAATTGTAPNPATTTAQGTPAPAATTAPQAASDAKASKSKRKSKKDAAASAADAGTAASAPGAASDTTAKKGKKAKKSKAASATAASGT
ncbi:MULTISPECIES: helix-hairpin-helix domain-containing protein [unclassified Paraburkholderia]|uniref:ComEA family DNA-binding protein n=1 Tax=unclassified Paraburkholderia TaxID=2615204 RepID=UPI002AB26200|nr:MULTISPECIES: helix-hairpin-helix domain-containing protein [unclassified Paraburkholderia]